MIFMPRKIPETHIIGRNIREGQRPGFMMAVKRIPANTHVGSESSHIKEAANVFLEKRGFHRQPDQWRDAVSSECAAAKRAKEAAPAPEAPL